MTPAPAVVVGIGSELRHDDGVGPAVARLVGVAVPGAAIKVHAAADPTELLDAWEGARLAVVVDATRSGATPGTVRVLELGDGAGGADAGRVGGGVSGTHAIGFGATLALARALGRAPARVVVVAVEGAEFGAGVGLSPAVAAAVPEAASRVLEIVEGVTACA